MKPELSSTEMAPRRNLLLVVAVLPMLFIVAFEYGLMMEPDADALGLGYLTALPLLGSSVLLCVGWWPRNLTLLAALVAGALMYGLTTLNTASLLWIMRAVKGVPELNLLETRAVMALLDIAASVIVGLLAVPLVGFRLMRRAKGTKPCLNA